MARTHTVTTRALVGATIVALLTIGWPVAAEAAALPPMTAVVGTAIPATGTIDPTGLVDPITWSVSPALPAGLDLDVGTATASGTGIVSGTPLVAVAATTYTITAIDSTPSTPVTRTIDLPLTIDGLVTPPSPVVATVGQALISSPTLSTSGLSAPLTFTIPAAPGWLHVSSGGVLSGVPDSTMGETSLPVSVLDINGATANGTLSLTVVASLMPSSQVITATSGVGLAPSTGFGAAPSLEYVITPSAAALTGLSFDGATGVLSGTPTRPLAPTPFTIQQVSVPGGAVLGQATVSVTVEGVLGAPSASVSGMVGTSIAPVTPYAAAAAAAAGLTPPLTFATVPALPGIASPGDLTIASATGLISGRPATATARSDYDVVVTDATGARARGPLSVVITGALLPATQSVAGSVGISLLSRTLSPVGLTAPVQFSISPALPTGLQFSSTTGVASGIPRAVQGATTYVVSASDPAGATASAKITVTIARAVLLAPVISSVVGGANAGSLVVTFTPPRLAPSGQTYTVEAYDVLGADLVASVDVKASPATIEGLTPGDDYQVIVVANATRDYDRVQSLPKLGTASLETTSAAATSAAPVSPATVVSQASKPNAASLLRAGIRLANRAQAAQAKRIVVKRAAARAPAKAPRVRMRPLTFVRLVVPVRRATGPQQVSIRVSGAWQSLGVAPLNARRQARLPVFSIATAGTYSLLVAGSVGAPSYVTLVVAG